MVGLTKNLMVQDHLHIRGEHEALKAATPKGMGSSPHTWRTPTILNALSVTNGIISTYVENTTCLSAINSLTKDHLHIRGEHSDLFCRIYDKTGSSPHTWRTPLEISDILNILGIISTYVENT